MEQTKGRRAKYLTVDRFEKFVSNEFWHLKVKTNAVLWITLTILAAIIAKWVLG